ncbi:hypothetical protein J6590_077365 [Homalodisca vitripennis]|nr:hypothetical protein J6590_077365 [Homalodisca vitripennis]
MAASTSRNNLVVTNPSDSDPESSDDSDYELSGEESHRSTVTTQTGFSSNAASTQPSTCAFRHLLLTNKFDFWEKDVVSA